MPTGKEERNTGAQRDPQHDEIARVARELWRQRQPGDPGSAEDDWYRAVSIVRSHGNVHAITTPGNSPGESESHERAAGFARAGTITDKEKLRMADNSTTASQPGSQTGSSGSLGNSLSDAYNTVSSRASDLMEREPRSMPRPEHREGALARSIEQQTARIPSDAWLWAAVGSIGLSLALELSGREKTATFVGHWAPTLLILGLYNKMVKLQGSDGL